jgi:NAD+ diphosphatase
MTRSHVPERSAALGYSANPLDRKAELRDDDQAIARLMADASARSIVIAGDVPVLKKSANRLDALFTLAEADALGQMRERVFLGLHHEPGDAARPVFATLLETEVAEAAQGRDGLMVLDLRSLAVQGLLPPSMLGIMAQAKSMLFWHQRHRFCAQCGGRSVPNVSGWKRVCEDCAAQHFPRTDPVSIMLAVKGERCVLGRQARFPPGVYSCLAGFIEPGETIEDAVRRELHEEAGISVGTVRYLSCQPWPFPSSLMIGCLAEATSDDLVVDTEELEDARWFTRDEVRRILTDTHPDGLTCPPAIAIANSLMRAWAFEGEEP